MRNCGEDDLCVGPWFANRTRSETENLIGLFANTLPLRTDLSGDPTFGALLARVRETILEAQARQDLPFDKLVEAVRPARDPSRNPLFQVMFVLQNAPLRSLVLPDLCVAPMRLCAPTARFDLTLAMMEQETGLAGEWEYNADLFDAETAAGLLSEYLMLLKAIAANPELRLSELPGASEAERSLFERRGADALASPTRMQFGEGGYVAPRTQTEKMLVDIYMQLLDIDSVGVHESFFDLGGHSLLACALAYRIREIRSCNLSPMTIFQAPSVAQLARILESEGGNNDGQHRVG
jgi:non-ribosomal peptide synthetase component F